VLGEAPTPPVRSRRRVYWIDVAGDIRYGVRDWRTEGPGLRGFLRPYLGPKVLAVGDGLDARPFITRSLGTLVGRSRRVLQRATGRGSRR
jgi:hypothetical protein